MLGEEKSMNTKDVRSMVDIIRDADSKELVIVSLFLLPLLLGAWSIFLNSLGFLDHRHGWKFLIICFLSALYVCGLIYMKRADTQEDKLKRARYHVETRLKRQGLRKEKVIEQALMLLEMRLMKPTQMIF
jgi:hypothetical protein